MGTGLIISGGMRLRCGWELVMRRVPCPGGIDFLEDGVPVVKKSRKFKS